MTPLATAETVPVGAWVDLAEGEVALCLFVGVGRIRRLDSFKGMLRNEVECA